MFSGFYACGKQGAAMPFSKAEILDESIDRLELAVRTAHALKHRFGEQVLVREVAMLSEEHIVRMLKSYRKYPRRFAADINMALAPYDLGLGKKWAELPPSRHSVVRNPKQMEDHVPTA
jgi:hypothetical protein